VPGAQQIGLMDAVDHQGFAEVGIFHPFGWYKKFFLPGPLFSKCD
jgi:hypothetical protein